MAMTNHSNRISSTIRTFRISSGANLDATDDGFDVPLGTINSLISSFSSALSNHRISFPVAEHLPMAGEYDGAKLIDRPLARMLSPTASSADFYR